MPVEARSACLPLPLMSQAKPSRGEATSGGEVEVLPRSHPRIAIGHHAVDLRPGAGHQIPDERARKQDTRVRRIHCPLVVRRAGLIAWHARRAHRREQARRLIRIPTGFEEACRRLARIVVPTAVREPDAVVEREPRGHAPAVLQIPFGLPVPAISIHPVGQFRVGVEHADERVRIAVARAERVLGVVPEGIVPHVVGALRLGLRRPLRVEPKLQVVPAARPRQVVIQRPPQVPVRGWERPAAAIL